MAHVRPTKDMRSLSMNEFAVTSTTSSKRSIPTPFLRHPSVVEVMEKKQREGLKNRLKMLHTGVLPSRNAAVSKNLPVIVKAPTGRVTLPKTLSRKEHYRSVLTLTEEPQEEQPSRLTRRHSFGGLICTYGGKDRTSSNSSGGGSNDFKSNNFYTDRLSQNKYKTTNTDKRHKSDPDNTKSRAKFQVAKDDSHLGKESSAVSFLPISKTQSQILTNISTEDGFKRTLNSEAKMNGNYKKHDNVDEVFSPSSTEGDLDENLNIKVQSSKDRGLKDNTDKPDQVNQVNQVNGHQEVITKPDRIENDIVKTTIAVSQTNSEPPRATKELWMTEMHTDGNGETRFSEDKEPRSLFSTGLSSEDKEPRSLLSTGLSSEDKEPRSLFSTGLSSEDKEPRSLFSTGFHSEDKEPRSLFSTGLSGEDKEPRSLFSTDLHSEDKEPRSLLSTGLSSEDKEPQSLLSTGLSSEDKEPRSLLSTGLHSEDKEPRSLFSTGLSSEDKEPRSLFSNGLESSLLIDINDSPSATPSRNHDTSHEIRLENSQQHKLATTAPTTFPDFGDSFPAQTGAYTPFEKVEDSKKVEPERPVFHEEHHNAFNDNAIISLTTNGKHEFSDDLKELNKYEEKSKDKTDNFWSTFEDSFTGPVKTTSNKSNSELIELEFQKSPDSGLGSYGFSDDSKEMNKSDDKSPDKTDAFWSAFEDSVAGSVQTTSSKSPSDPIEVEVQKRSYAGLGEHDSSNGLKELTKTDNEIEDGSDTFLSVVEDSFAGSVETTSGKSRTELIEVEVQKCPDAGLGFCIEGGKGSALGDRPVTVKRVFNAATHRCLKEGDEILTVSSQDTSTLTHIEAWKLFKTLPEGPVKMTIIRRME